MADRKRKHDGAVFRKRPKPEAITDPLAIAAELMRFCEAYNELPEGPPEQVDAWAAEIDRLGEAIAEEPSGSVLRDDIETLRQLLVEIAGYFRAGNPKALAHAMRACGLYGYRLAIFRCRVQGIEHAAAVGRDQINRPAKSMTPQAIEARGVTAGERQADAERLFKSIVKAEPGLPDKAVRHRIARKLGISIATLRRYLPAKRAKELR